MLLSSYLLDTTLGAVALWLGTIRNSAQAADERLTAAGCVSYVPALIYYCGMISAFTGDSGASVAPWYLQLLSVPAACLLFLGCARSGRRGRVTGAALVVLSAYMLCATYLVKLIPLYSGHPPAGARLMEIWRWYIHDTRRHELLANTALASPAAIWVLTGVVAVMGLTLGCSLALAPEAEDSGAGQLRSGGN